MSKTIINQPNLFMEDPTTSQLSSSQERPPQSTQQINGYRIISKIQPGGQANVYLSHKNGQQYAMKVYRNRENSLNQFRNEVSITSGLEFPGIVPIIEVIEDTFFGEGIGEAERTNIIVTPFYSNGDLMQYIKHHGGLQEDCCRFFAKNLLSTFLYLRSKNILHGDIKAQNIIFGDDYKPLLLDFGFSLRDSEKCSKFVGDLRYASPEVVKRVEYTAKSEVYSLGILLFYSLTGAYPFTAARVSDINYRLLLEKKVDIFWQRIKQKVKVDLSQDFKEAFVKMVNNNAKNRCNFEDLLEIAWFKQKDVGLERYSSLMKELSTIAPLKEIIFN